MPIKIPDNLPAFSVLNNENIFVMTEERAVSQDIRPLKILILNLMPTKIETETQILRLLSNSPIQVEAELLQTATHEVKNVSKEHMLKFYKTFDDIKNERFDGMVVTGAPVENMEFEHSSTERPGTGPEKRSRWCSTGHPAHDNGTSSRLPYISWAS